MTRRRRIPRGDHWSQLSFELDTSLAVLLLRVASFPLHHGAVGAIRTLGRAGVPVFAVTEDRYTPAAVSRYLAGRVPLLANSGDDESQLLDWLVAVGRKLHIRPLIICTDDEAAVLVAEGADRLRDHFVIPGVLPGLPRRLASKRGLFELCREHKVSTPLTGFPTTRIALDAVVEKMKFPVVFKNTDPWLRLSQPVVPGSTIIAGPDDLAAVVSDLAEPFGVLVQEYLPGETSIDWIVGGYCNAASETPALFTGRKLRSWPAHTGSTAYARVEANDELASLTRAFCKQIGYQGIFDADWRFDQRDGTYNLLDFNPRVGAQFRLFENEAGVDVVRAMHLDLSGRPIPRGNQVEGQQFVVENLDLTARLVYRGTTLPAPTPKGRLAGTRLAWAATDDPLPVIAMGVRQLHRWSGKVVHAIRGEVKERLTRPHPGS